MCYNKKMKSLNYKNKEGFTLIELLVVIAIIMLLITINILAVTNYRDKGKDARIESVLGQLRSVAAMIQHDANSYQGICDSKNHTLNDQNNMLKTIEDDVKKLNNQKDVICHSNEVSYCSSSPLTTANGFCVDSTGYAGRDKNICSRNATCQ